MDAKLGATNAISLAGSAGSVGSRCRGGLEKGSSETDEDEDEEELNARKY